MKIFFDVAEYYYLPQYEPVIAELVKHNVSTYLLVEMAKKDLFLEFENRNKKIVELLYFSSEDEKEVLISQHRPDWIFFGNYTQRSQNIPNNTKFALMQHGVGPKSCYYSVSDGDFDVRFVEGAERLKKLQTLYPDKAFVDVGFAKMDPVINASLDVPELTDLGLDANKKTLLYAPSFFPCSIECLPLDFPEVLKEYNIILKPHFFSLSREKFNSHQDRLRHWNKQDNVYLVPIEKTNILPYYVLSDLMFSDASSTVFEFIALDKPIIWYQNYKLRWSYKGIFSYRLKKRMDFDLKQYFSIGTVANNFSELCDAIRQQTCTPLSYQEARRAYVENLIGKVDGKVSQRIVNYLMASQNGKT